MIAPTLFDFGQETTARHMPELPVAHIVADSPAAASSPIPEAVKIIER